MEHLDGYSGVWRLKIRPRASPPTSNLNLLDFDVCLGPCMQACASANAAQSTGADTTMVPFSICATANLSSSVYPFFRLKAHCPQHRHKRP